MAFDMYAPPRGQPSPHPTTGRLVSLVITYYNEVNVISNREISSSSRLFPPSVPYLVRFRQCIIEYTLPTTTSRRPLYNAIKYATSFPVIYLSAALRIFPDFVGENGGGKVVQETWKGDVGIFRFW